MQPLRIYYAATAIFLLLDYLFGVNVRVAFLEPWPVWRLLYYLFCFACLGIMVWKPALTVAVSTIESLITLSALILHMGIRVMSLSVGVLEQGGESLVHIEEILNFVISGLVAWVGWHRGSLEIHRRLKE